MEYSLTPIAEIKSCYREKFGVPRQPGLLPEIEAEIHFAPAISDIQAFEGLEQFSHLWILFAFHLNANQSWKPRVRPPRLGGNQSMGVFATRSPFRPNPIGLSVVRYAGLQVKPDCLILKVLGGDFVNGTPVLDIKPYIPYADAIPDARGGFADTRPDAVLEVGFTPSAEATLEHYSVHQPKLKSVICHTLTLDPRPAYRKGKDQKEYGIRLFEFNVRWLVEGSRALVTGIERVDE